MSDKRQHIFGKSNGHCWYCGDDLRGRKWHADHFHTVKRYNGELTHPERDVIENLVPSCPRCNIMKDTGDIEYLRWLIGNFIKRLNRDITVYRHAKRYGLVEETGKEVKFYFEKHGLEVEYKEVNEDASETQI